jgi:hypothetical protein
MTNSWGARHRSALTAWSAVLVVLMLVAGFLVWVGSWLFGGPNLHGLERDLAASPCVTWADGKSANDGFDVGDVAFVEFGVDDHCTADQITTAYGVATRELRQKVANNRDTVLISAAPAPASPPDDPQVARAPTGSAQIELDPGVGTYPSTIAFRQDVVDWLTVRRQVDHGAQLSFVEPDVGGPLSGERFTVNSTQPAVGQLRTRLSPRLAKAAWRVTVPQRGHAALRKENSTPLGALTIETNRGLPDALSFAVGRAVDRAWPSKTASAQQYVSIFREYALRPGADRLDEDAEVVHVGVWGVASSQSYARVDPDSNGFEGPATDDALVRPERTSAWPALTSTIDHLDSSGHAFEFGLVLSSRRFHRGDDRVLDLGDEAAFNSGLATISSIGCPPIDPINLSTDADVVETSFWNYWVARGKPGFQPDHAGSCAV